ncbi:Protein of unknown function [Gryllus bimaculatus]|nr:Protein of unknown function [Gryllus bimaculatus]
MNHSNGRSLDYAPFVVRWQQCIYSSCALLHNSKNSPGSPVCVLGRRRSVESGTAHRARARAPSCASHGPLPRKAAADVCPAAEHIVCTLFLLRVIQRELAASVFILRHNVWIFDYYGAGGK